MIRLIPRIRLEAYTTQCNPMKLIQLCGMVESKPMQIVDCTDNYNNTI